MSGILDNKSRVMDVLITSEGRRQLSSGKMNIEYVVFTDDATHYSGDIISGSADVTNRIYLEACNLPQDQVTFEADDSGRLNPFKNVSGISVSDGRLSTTLFDAASVVIRTGSLGSVTWISSGSINSSVPLSGTEFASQADTLLQGSADSFNKLRMIATRGYLYDDDVFKVSNDELTFSITETKPITGKKYASINNVEGLISDLRLSTQTNFAFLPPINKVRDSSIDKSNSKQILNYRVANYVPWGPTQQLSPQAIHDQVQYCENVGLTKNISFNPTSKSNNLFAQIFEFTHDELRKLDVIDYGRHTYLVEGVTYNRHYFFAGRVLTDDNGDDTFIHLFTLAFM